jgi:hypothetical protein
MDIKNINDQHENGVCSMNLETIDLTKFKIINGQNYNLISPIKNYIKWTKDQLYYRSCMFDGFNSIVSMGFPKFFNYDEQNQAVKPFNIDSIVHVREKIDGSLFIVSKYKGQYIMRTRESFNCDRHEENYGQELDYFRINILPKLNDYCVKNNLTDDCDTWILSFQFEWQSDKHIIIVKFPEQFNFFLLGGVFHNRINNRLMDQLTLDVIGLEINVKRPNVYFSPNQVKGINLNWYVNIQGIEGFVFYCADFQTMYKVKTHWYLNKHKFKFGLNSFKSFVELIIAEKIPLDAIYQFILDNFDHETFVACEQWIKIIDDIIIFVSQLNNISKKESIEIIKTKYNKQEQKIALSLLKFSQNIIKPHN